MSTSPYSSQPPDHQHLCDLKTRLIQTVGDDFMAPLQRVHQSTYLLASFGNTWEIKTCIQHLRGIQEAVEQMNLLLEKCLEVEKKEE
jgi:K+-sensing histidine kinase KdpD